MMPFCNLFFFTLRPPRIFAKSLSTHDSLTNVVSRKWTRTQHICWCHIASLWIFPAISWGSFNTVTAMQLRCWNFKTCMSKLQKHQFTIHELHLQMYLFSNAIIGILWVFYCNFIELFQHHEVQKCFLLGLWYFLMKSVYKHSNLCIFAFGNAILFSSNSAWNMKKHIAFDGDILQSKKLLLAPSNAILTL